MYKLHRITLTQIEYFGNLFKYEEQKLIIMGFNKIIWEEF